MTSKIPAVNSELALVGAVLADPERVWPIVQKRQLGADVFADSDCRAAWGAFLRLTASGRPIDPVTVMTETALGAATLDSMIEIGVPAHCEHHADAVYGAAVKRQALATINQADGTEALRLALRQIEATLPSVEGGGAENASDWLATEPPPPEYILEGVVEVGARVLLVGSSKTKKSFAASQVAFCVAAGCPFLGMAVKTPRRVLLANLENAADWQHRRSIAICRALDITPVMLGDRLAVINGRGKGVDLSMIEAAAIRHKAELVILDPLYKLDGGADECDQSERKKLVGQLEAVGARTGAALVVVHHDPKGTSGDRNIRDRGAGSSIINRDVDCTLALTPWSEADPESDSRAVLSVLARNAPPRPDLSLVFRDGAFFHDADRVPSKATSKTRSLATQPFNADAAVAQVASRTMTRMQFREAIKGFGGTRDGRDAWTVQAIADGVLFERRIGQREKKIGTRRAFELDLSTHTSDISERPET